MTGSKRNSDKKSVESGFTVFLHSFYVQLVPLSNDKNAFSPTLYKAFKGNTILFINIMINEIYPQFVQYLIIDTQQILLLPIIDIQ